MACSPRAHGRLDGRAQGGGEPALASRCVGPHVHDLDLREARAADTVREVEPVVAAGLDVGQRLERGRGGCEHDGGAGQLRADHGHVAGVVDDPVLLLEGGVVLLVDDDEAQFREGQEEGRARAHHDPDLALRHRPPGDAPLSLGEGPNATSPAGRRSGPGTAPATGR